MEYSGQRRKGFLHFKELLIPNPVSKFDQPNDLRLNYPTENTGSNSVWSSQHEM